MVLLSLLGALLVLRSSLPLPLALAVALGMLLREEHLLVLQLLRSRSVRHPRGQIKGRTIKVRSSCCWPARGAVGRRRHRRFGQRREVNQRMELRLQRRSAGGTHSARGRGSAGAGGDLRRADGLPAGEVAEEVLCEAGGDGTLGAV